MYKSEFFDFSGFAKALTDNNGSVVEVVEETINSVIWKHVTPTSLSQYTI